MIRSQFSYCPLIWIFSSRKSNNLVNKVHERSLRIVSGDNYNSFKKLLSNTAKNIVISPDFLVWKFCGKAQFPYSFGRIARNCAETVPLRKISTPGNQVKLRYFSQCKCKKIIVHQRNLPVLMTETCKIIVISPPIMEKNFYISKKCAQR